MSFLPRRRVRRRKVRATGLRRSRPPRRQPAAGCRDASLAETSKVRNTFACVGLIVLAGCFTFVVVPDSEVSWLRPPPPPRAEGLPTVVIDPGHGGNDEGASANGLKEKNLTLDIALRLEKALQSYNFPTVVTRRVDQYVPLAARVEMANRLDNAIFVSIHFNSNRSSTVGGVETFYSVSKVRPDSDWSWVGVFNRDPPPSEKTGEILAGFIQASLVTKTDLRNRGIKSSGLFVTRRTSGPAVLVESGFISNSLEAALLKNADYRQRLAAAIAEGVLSYQKTRPRAMPTPNSLVKAR